VPSRDGCSRAADLHYERHDKRRSPQTKRVTPIRRGDSKTRHEKLCSTTLLRRDFAEVTTPAETRPIRSQQSRGRRYRTNPSLSLHTPKPHFHHDKTTLKREASLNVLARGPSARRKTIRYTRTAKPAALTTYNHIHDTIRYPRIRDNTRRYAKRLSAIITLEFFPLYTRGRPASHYL